MIEIIKNTTLFMSVLLLGGCGAPQQDKTENTMNTNSTKDTLPVKGYAEVNGLNVYYEIYGTGKPLVLIHGGGSTIETSFGRIIPHLSKTHQVIAVEMQAHGHTADRGVPLSFEQDADDVAALLKKLGISKADVLGFSNGGSTAFQLAVRHPGSVDKVIVASGLFKKEGAPAQFWEFMKHGTFEQMPQQFKTAFLKCTNDSAKLHVMYERCVERMNTFKDVPDEQITSVKAPVLLINGENDVATREHMEKMAKLIPNCKLYVFPGGHGEYMGEITTLKNDTVTQFPIVPVVEEFLR